MKLSLNRDRAVLPAWMGPPWQRRAAQAVAGLAPRAGTINVIVTNDRVMRQLNRRYRGKDKTTDVLSFSYLENGTTEGAAGDVFISHQTLSRDARRIGVAPEDLALRIVVHGFLHVLGYDHETNADASRMERRERTLLRRVLPERTVRTLF